jgi:glycosyltransferase involved in cell wall biosynthesis
LKVGLVIYGSLEILTGGFIYDRKLVDFIQAHGAIVEVCSLPWRDYASHLTDNLSYKFFRRLEKSDFDILLEDELNHPSLLAANRLLLNSSKYPVVSIVHHLRCSELRSNVANRFYRMIERMYLKTADGFIFNSGTTRNSVETLGLAPKPYVTAYPGRNALNPGVNSQFIRKRAEDPGPLRLLFIGSLIPRKELHTLVEALSHIPRKDWALRVVGALDTDKNYTNEVLGRLKRFDLEDNVSLLGSMSSEEIEAEYRNSQVLAVPSSYEGFGIVYLESMGFGAPPLASTGGAASEMITDGLNGFLVSPGDIKGIAEKISRLAEDRALLVQMGEAALDRFAAHPTWDQGCEKIFNFMKEMVSTSHV